MAPMLLLPLLLTALGSAPARAQAPLNLTVHYEALCPDSKHFVVDQLEPLWRRIGSSDVLSLQFVPWGKAWEHEDPTGDGAYVTCQHGPAECWGNRLHGCVLSQLADAGQQLAAVSCLMRNYRWLHAAAPICVRAAGLDWRRVARCSFSESALADALAFGRRTRQLQPPLTFVPTVTADGQQDGQQLMLYNLEFFVCETWRMRTGEPAPGCPTDSA
ncbi:Gamma-interferon-inducible lysosomal thiol reductase [Amphibalanus amphitrite]|uniref:Gamma-interferon-inducible lysosomal thiol reductase n=1 Tax=Amphibalanus amphitrite TaxID=1232801 RepID=A0A6A4W5L8_AMPAM|nr:Gamma-interferon-inducible lysosomal thiol reductase [Amphibalanus amphitrite]